MNIQYAKQRDTIKIIRVLERTSTVSIPSHIEQLPVVEIAPYAFAITEELSQSNIHDNDIQFECVPDQPYTSPQNSAIGQPLIEVYLPDTIHTIGAYAFFGCTSLELVQLPEHVKTLSAHCFDCCGALKKLYIPSQLKTIEAYAFHNCRQLEKILLPETVEKIGQYAFYNCRELQQINIPKKATDLGTGLFLNCDHLQYIHFGRCKHIADLTSVLNHELHLTIVFEHEETAKLLIPDFQYEYIEDTPARQFHQVNYGTGHLFRQCIGNSDIDFRRFDELFYLTRREDEAEMVLLLVMYRLQYPYRLQQKHKEQYIQYLKEHLIYVFSYYAKKDDLQTIRLLQQWQVIENENISKLLEISIAYQKTEITGYLLQEQQKIVKFSQKTFDL